MEGTRGKSGSGGWSFRGAGEAVAVDGGDPESVGGGDGFGSNPHAIDAWNSGGE